MRILIIVPRVLFPSDTGAKIRSANLFAELAREHDTTMVCLRSNTDRAEDISKMREICACLEMVGWDEVVTHSPRFYLEVLRGVLSPLPYSVRKFAVTAQRERVRRLLKEQHFDVLICDSLPLVPNTPFPLDVPAVLFQHNVEAVIRRRQCEKALNPLKKAYLYWDWLRTHRYEAAASRLFDHCIMVSDNDCQTMMSEYGVSTTSSIPLGVDMEFFRPEVPDPSSEGSDIVFTGCMDWMPNIDGVRFFVREVLPLIRREVDCHLWVVGRRPTREVEKLGRDGQSVTVTGAVEDIRPYVARGAVYVVPLRIGGGTRIKIFEALAMGKAVVSTSLGAEGLPVTHNKNILLADSAEALARNVVSLLRDPEMRRRLGEAGRQHMVENYTWEVAARAMAEACRKVVEERL